MKKINLKLAVIIILVGLGSIILKSLIYVTEPGQATVIFNSFSGLERNRVLPPGVILLKPFIEHPITYNLRTKIWEFTNEPAPNPAGSAITVNTADGQAFSIDVSIALHPRMETLDDLHAQVGENYINTVVVPVARSKIRDISAEFNSQDFYVRERRKLIERKATQLIAQEMSGADYKGEKLPLIQIEGVFLGTPNFPEGLKKSIERKQVASITAQTAAVKAKIQQKETERLLIAAQANQKAIELKGQAATANTELADLLFWEKLEERINTAKSNKTSKPFKIIKVEGNANIFLNISSQDAEVLQSTLEKPKNSQK